MRHFLRLFVLLCAGWFWLTAHQALWAGEAGGASVRSYVYLLQAEEFAPTRAEVVQRLAACGRDLIVVDAAFTGGLGGRWTVEELAAIRAGKQGRRVLCYLSVGEAEDYRPYWQAGWKPGSPTFLMPENPNWPGNFKVKYWDSAWQSIILCELQRIVAQGFDGVLLDIVDGFEYFENQDGEIVDHRKNPETGNTYRQDMIQWVGKIATAARTGKYRSANGCAVPGAEGGGAQPATAVAPDVADVANATATTAVARPEFWVVPQNATQLLEDAGYASLVSGQALEDLYAIGDKRQSQEHINYVMHFLRPFMRSGKPVLLTEYSQEKAMQEYVRRMARAAGLRLLITDRALKTLGSE